MAAQLNVPWVEELLRLLSGGEWHDYQESLEKTCLLIPANLAWEKGEYYRSYHFIRRGLPVKPRRVGSDVETIHTGRRIIMGNLIRLMASRHILEIEYLPGRRRKPNRLRLMDE